MATSTTRLRARCLLLVQTKTPSRVEGSLGPCRSARPFGAPTAREALALLPPSCLQCGPAEINRTEPGALTIPTRERLPHAMASYLLEIVAACRQLLLTPAARLPGSGKGREAAAAAGAR